MPDVGVLSLTIESNANKAAEGLNQLAGALESIQTAVGTELNLKGIVSPLNKLTKAVNDSKSLANIGTFLNSIASYKKAFKDLEGVQFNAEPIKQLKDAVGDGIKIGQAGTQLNNLRAALEGEWKTDNAYQAGIALSAIGEGAKSLTGTSLASHAKNLSAMATSISEYAKSIAELKAAATGGVSASSAIDSSQISATASAMGANIPAGAAIGIFSNDSEAIEAARQMALAMLDAAKKVLGIASPSTEFKKVGEYTVEGLIEGVRSRIGDAAKVLSDMTNAAILSAKDNAPLAAKEVADAIKSTIATMMEGIDLPDTVKNTIISAAKEAGDFTKSLVGSVSKENYGVAAKISSEAVFATITTATNNALGSMKTMQNDLVQVKNEVQSAGEVIEEKVSNGIETAAANTETLRNNVQDVKKELSDVKPYASIEDAFKGISFGRQRENDLMSNWLHGNGTEREQLYAFKETARMFGMTVDDVKAKVNELLEAEGSSFRFTIGEEIAKENPAIQETNASMSEHISLLHRFANAVGPTLSHSIDAIKSGIKNLGSNMKALFPTLTGLAKRFKGMIIMRTMRYAIRQLASGLSEGIKNVYYYSQAIGGEFALAMDSAASSLEKMKNSIGAAFAPLLQSLIPILQSIVKWFIEIINYVNQFFALIRGQKTWTRAVEKTKKAYDDQTKSAKKASAAVKDLLADWDELNIIQSEAGGGGGGGTTTAAEDYMNMFEQVDKFNDKLKSIIDTIKENLDSVKRAAIDIGAAILGWKISKVFEGVLGTIGSLAAAAGIITFTWEATNIIDKQYLKDGDAGWLVADVLTNIVGDYLAGTIVESVLGEGTGALTFGLAMAVSGGISYGIALANPENDKSRGLKVVAGIKKIIADMFTVAGFVVMTGEAAASVVAGLTFSTVMFTAAAAITYYVESIKTAEEAAKEAFERKNEGGIDVEELFAEIQKRFDKASNGYAIVVDVYKNVPQLKQDLADALGAIDNFTGIINGDDALTQDEADRFKKAWETVFSSFAGITTDSFTTVLEELSLSLNSSVEEIRKTARELRIETLKMQKGLTEGQAQFKERMDTLIDKIVMNEASEEEILEYEQYVESLAKANDVAVSTMQNLALEAENLDLSDTEKVFAFIGNIGTASADAYQEIEDGLAAGKQALDDLRSQNEVLRYFIGEDQYNANKELLDKIEQNIIGEAEDRKNKVKESVQSAYGSIINNALEGIKFLKTDENGLPNRQEVAQYLIKFVAPLVQQIEDSGGTVSQEIKDAITNAYGIGDPSLSMLDIQGGERRKKVLDNFIREYLGLDENNVYEMDIKLKFKEYFDNAPTQGSYYGMGNIDLNNRQILNNGDGSFSTENSSTIEIDGKYIVIPTVVDGKQLELDEAIENYKQTGKHLGIFDTLEDSEAYAQQLHERQEQFYQAQFIKDQALEVLAGMNNGDIDRYNYDQRILQLVQDYGSDIVQKVLDQIGEEYGWNWKGNSGTNPVNMGNRSFVNPLEGTVGSVAKTPDYNPMYRPTTTTEPASGGIDYNQMANSMATAATSANQNVVSELQSIMMQLSRILNKDWTVVVKPSADWGQHNQRSGNMWNRSSGENY